MNKTGNLQYCQLGGSSYVEMDFLLTSEIPNAMIYLNNTALKVAEL